MSEETTIPGVPGGPVIKLGDSAKDAKESDPALVSKEPEETAPVEDEECPPVGCVYVFISPIPGSTVVINGTKERDGLLEDCSMLHFTPVGEKKVHPILIDAMYTDYGMIVTHDPKLAWVLNKSIQKGNAQFFHYNPNDPAHQTFQPEVHAIQVPSGAATP